MSFVVTAALEHERNAELHLRIDDLDSDRMQTEYVSDIYESLQWLGISWVEGPTSENDLNNRWSQRHRVDQYDKLIQQLLNGDYLYPCDCSRKEIADRGGLGSFDHECRSKTVDPNQYDVSWRVKLPDDCVVEIQDEIRGKILVDLKSAMPDFVIRRRYGIPSYQIASLADDLHFGIDLVVRGIDLLESTAAQLHLAGLLGKSEFSNSTFIHHSLITAKDGAKLSKSAGSEALKIIRNQGVKSGAVYGMIAEQLGIESLIYDLNSFAKVFDPQLHLRG